MSKVYLYRKHIQWGQYIIIIFLLLSIVSFGLLDIAAIQLWHSLNPGSSIPITFIVVMCLINLIPLVVFLPGWYLYYRMAGVRVTIENDAVIYKHRGGETRINFDKITRIDLPSIPYLGGWITIVAGKEKIRLTVVVNEIGDFVQTLKASLDKIGLANRYDESKLFLFLKTAVFSDQSWDRLHAIFWKFILFTFSIGLLGFAITKISRTGEFFWVLFSFLFPTLAYMGTEIAFGRKIAKTATRETFFVPQRDIAYENAVYKQAAIVGCLIYFLLALIVIFF